jgi:hypothetical protein
MTFTAIATTLALLITIGVAAWQVGSLHTRTHAATTSLPRRSGGPGRPASSQASVRTPPPAPSGRPAGGSAVAIAPAAVHAPHVHQVANLLTDYFAAINHHDFQSYVRLFIPAIQATMQHFGRGYRSTVDSGAVLTGVVATGPQGLAATVTFTSHQNPAASPDHAACNHWDITIFLKQRGNSYRIGHPRPGFPNSVQPCA